MNSNVFDTTFSPNISLGKFSNYHKITLNALYAIFYVGINGNFPFFSRISSYLIASFLS